MTYALDMARCRRPLLRRWGAFLAVVAMAAHMFAMALHQPAAGASIPPDLLASLCITSGEAPHDLPGQNSGGGAAHQGLFCPVCQSLHAGGYAPQSPVLAGPAWAPSVSMAAVVAPTPPPRLVLTDLNPRGPPPIA